MKIALVANSVGNYSGKKLWEAIQNSGHTPMHVSPIGAMNVINKFKSNHNKILIEGSSIEHKQINLFIPRITSVLKHRHLLYQLSEVLGIFTTYSTEGLINASDKMRTLQRCSMNGLRVPKTVLISESSEIKSALEYIGTPCIVKSVYGSKGIGVSLLDSYSSAQSTLQILLNYTQPLLIEEFISTGNCDIRAIVIGNKVVAAMKRYAPMDDFRANLSQGGKGLAYSLDPSLQQVCIKAAKSLPLEIAGVDLILNKHGEPYVIEVNGNFGFGIQRITGIDIAKEIVQYSIQRYKAMGNPMLADINHNTWMDDYIIDCFEKVKGKEVKYTDRAGNDHKKQINSANDLINIMRTTFRLNIL